MTASMVVALLAAALAPQAQQADDRWLAFEGCWAPVADESMTTTAGPVVCVQQAAEGVVFRTYVNGQRQTERMLVTDDVARAVSESGCTGTERARWSADGRRVFVQSELACGGATSRSSSMVLAFVSSESFVDVQSVRVAGEATVRTARYRAVPSSQYPTDFQLVAGKELARETGRLYASAPLDIDDVLEANRVLYPDALNALLAARRSGFALDAQLLKQLRAEGVAKSTVDVMVALTYPDRFAVADRTREPREGRGQWRPTRTSMWDDPYYGYSRWDYDPWRSFYCGPFGCYNNSYYGYGGRYGSYGYGNNWWYGTPQIWVVPVGPSGEPLNQGRSGTVSGGGHSRGTQPSSGTARPRGASGGTYTGAAMPRSTGGSGTGGSAGGGSSSGGSGSVGSGGHSSGSGSTSSGTAQPRGGGE